MTKHHIVKLSASPELVKCLSTLSEILESRFDFFSRFCDIFVKAGSIDMNLAVTARAVEGGVLLEPSDSLRDFISTVLASEFNAEFVSDSSGHGDSLNDY